jgi:porphobilinogen synthase
MHFPAYRPRRLRRNEALRTMVRETVLRPEDFIYPLFVIYGTGIKREIPSMPGQYQFSVDRLASEIEEIRKLGILGVILFGIPEKKDPLATEAYNDHGIIQKAIREIKKNCPEMIVVTDICLCEYTSHGHCGKVVGDEIANDETLELLSRMALSHARAGADIVAPSDMMDGRVKAIRNALDEEGFSSIPIMAYSAKYASCFYGPFREAAESAPQFGDRRSYQMDPPNAREALREIAMDIEEGADIVMVKPALPYLDIIRRVRDEFNYPVAAYNVSGEYSMIKAADRLGWLDGKRAMMEALISIKRAGADIILTYFAKEASEILMRGV